MRSPLILLAALLAFTAAAARAEECHLTPKEVVTQFMTEFYVHKQVRAAFETWVDPGYIQHNPLAPTGRAEAIAFLEPFFFGDHPDASYSIKRNIAEGRSVRRALARQVHRRGARVCGRRHPARRGCKVVEHRTLQMVPEIRQHSTGCHLERFRGRRCGTPTA
jgi:predicted SnoaL-like aldol condensation-catalyzing enzyme